MQIGLYFGSFNPIHNGHCIIANYILQETSIEQIWLIVSPQNPLKASGSLLNEYHRLHLAQVATEGEKGIRVSNVEFSLPRPSYTIDTLTYLSEKYPQHQFSVIMGSDSYQNIDKWKNATVLKASYPIYIYQRPKFEITEVTPGATLLLAPRIEISSTRIRELIRQGKSIRFLVPDAVREEIENNHYYRTSNHPTQ